MFKKLENYDIIKKYAPLSTEQFCNYTLGVLYMWEKDSGYEYQEVNDTLILRFTNHEGKKVFLYPIGKDIDGALKIMMEAGTDDGTTIVSVSDETAVSMATKYPCMSVTQSRDWADYVYNAHDLREFRGKHYNGQRNHINKFVKQHPDYTYNTITPNDVPKIKEFLKNLDFYAPVGSLKAEELERCYIMLDGMFDIGCVGGYIETDGKVVAFCIGETVGNTFYDHVEKGDKSYEGVYQVLVKETANAFCQDVKYINREEDCGDIGLRISKMQYRPCEIKAKNTVTIGTAFCKITSPVCIKTQNLILREFCDCDTEEYYRLASDVELNKYWGYDYRDDVKSTPPLDYFIKGVYTLIARHEEYPLAITLGGQFVGEATMHNFDHQNGVEVGVRILPEFQSKGYGKEAIKGICDYLKNVIGVDRVKAKCYLENTPSKKTFESLGFKKLEKDETFYYFELR